MQGRSRSFPSTYHSLLASNLLLSALHLEIFFQIEWAMKLLEIDGKLLALSRVIICYIDYLYGMEKIAKGVVLHSNGGNRRFGKGGTIGH